jgi:hypothetical protein
MPTWLVLSLETVFRPAKRCAALRDETWGWVIDLTGIASTVRQVVRGRGIGEGGLCRTMPKFSARARAKSNRRLAKPSGYLGTVNGKSRSETGIPSGAIQPISLQERTKAHYTIGPWGLAFRSALSTDCRMHRILRESILSVRHTRIRIRPLSKNAKPEAERTFDLYIRHYLVSHSSGYLLLSLVMPKPAPLALDQRRPYALQQTNVPGVFYDELVLRWQAPFHPCGDSRQALRPAILPRNPRRVFRAPSLLGAQIGSTISTSQRPKRGATMAMAMLAALAARTGPSCLSTC